MRASRGARVGEATCRSRGRALVAGSAGSGPAITANRRVASATERAWTPIVSIVHATGRVPWRLTRPYVGLNPTPPLNAAGRRTSPAVCVSIVASHMPVATATPEPGLEPPGLWAGFQGLRVGAGSLVASSVHAVLPMTTAPAARARATAVASADWLPVNSADPASVG